jgi:hypothetical protein
VPGRCVCHYLFGQAAVSDEAVEMSDPCCIYAARVVHARGQICSSYVVQGSMDACPRTEPQNPPFRSARKCLPGGVGRYSPATPCCWMGHQSFHGFATSLVAMVLNWPWPSLHPLAIRSSTPYPQQLHCGTEENLGKMNVLPLSSLPLDAVPILTRSGAVFFLGD